MYPIDASRPACLMVAILLLFLSGSVAAGASYPPRDDADRDGSLVRFRAAALAAFEARDLEAVRKHVHPFVRFGDGASLGRDRFLERLRAEPLLWTELATALKRGGQFADRDRFIAPYAAFVSFEGRDPLQTGLLVDADVPVRDRPDEEAETLATLSHALVRVPHWAPGHDGTAPPEGWVGIVAPDGRHGFVREESVIRAVTYTLEFTRINGIWWIGRIDTTFE